jgi:uncharacterized protein YndB with AHSA1/START domain
MTAETRITAEPGTPFITITREFDAPRELVFRAYSEPDLIARWLGPRGLKMTIDHFDVRAGGGYRYVHTDEDGNAYAFHGVFHGTPSVADGIVQTFEFEGTPGHACLERMTFEERDGHTVIHQRSVFESVADRDGMVETGMESGVNDSMERLDEVLADLAARG